MQALNKHILITVLFVAGLFLCACEKPADTEVRITVKNANGDVVEGATVHMYGESSDTVYVNRLSLYDLSQTTNDGGYAVFNFNDFYGQGDNGFAVLKVDVDQGSLTGSGHATIRENETQEIEIVIQ